MRIVGALMLVMTVGILAPAHAEPHRDGGEHFVEFRSRSGYVFGHTYIVTGRRLPNGRTTDEQYAGIYPIDEHVGLVFGTFLPVSGQLRGVADDRNKPPTAVYRRPITAAQYAKLRGDLGRARYGERPWHLLLYNCNDFAIDVAHRLGMRTPPNILLPAAFVRNLRSLNER